MVIDPKNAKQYDIIIRRVPHYGFLPMVKDAEGNEVFRGEFAKTPEDALVRVHANIDRYEFN